VTRRRWHIRVFKFTIAEAMLPEAVKLPQGWEPIHTDYLGSRVYITAKKFK